MRITGKSWCGAAVVLCAQVAMCGAVVFSQCAVPETGAGKGVDASGGLFEKRGRELEEPTGIYQSVTGLLKDKSPAFGPVEKSHELEKRMCKFVIRLDVQRDGSAGGESRDYFFYRCRSTLRNKLDSLSVGDRISVRGRQEVFEHNGGAGIDDEESAERLPMSVFIVDQIES